MSKEKPACEEMEKMISALKEENSKLSQMVTFYKSMQESQAEHEKSRFHLKEYMQMNEELTKTLHRQAELEKRLEFALSASHTGAWDLDLKDLSAIRTLEHDMIFGYKTLLPYWSFDMFLQHVLEEDRKHVSDSFEKAVTSGTDWSFECRIRRCDGEVRWIWACGRHQPDEYGKVLRMAGIVQDITERKTTDLEVLRKNEEIENFFNCAIDLLCIADTRGNFIRLNKEWKHVLGYTSEELMSQKFLNFVHPEDIPATLSAMGQLSEQKNVVNFTNRYRCKNGEYKWIEWKSFPAGDRIYAAARDITDRKAFQETLIQKNMELESSEEEIRAANEELIATSDALRESNAGLHLAKEKAEESERHLQMLIDNAPDAIFIQVDTSIVYANRQAAMLLGANSPEDLVGRNVSEHFHPGELHPVTNALEWLQPDEKAGTGPEKMFVRPDGSIIHVEVSAVPFVHLGRNSTLVFLRNITDRIRYEEKLQKSYNLLHNLTAQVPGVVYQYQLFPDGRSCFPYSSPGIYEIYEVTSDEVREDASKVFTRIHPDDYDYIVESIMESARNQSIYQSEFRVILPTQGLRWRRCDAKPIRLDDGSTLWHGIITDITGKKMTEEKIQEQQLLFETMFNSITDGLIITDTNRNIILANKGMYNTFGYEPSEIIGKSTGILYGSEELFSEAGEQVFNEKAVNRETLYVTQYRDKWGNVFPGETFGAKLYNHKGEWIGNLGIMRNISDRLNYIEELKIAREKAEESDKLKTAFLHNISHEIRTPMNAIIGFSELLVKPDITSEKSIYYTDVINQSCSQLLSIIDDIINLATIEARMVVVHETTFDLNAALRLIFHQNILKTARQNINLDLQLPSDDTFFVKTDKTKLEEIVTNLVGNALKFTKDGSITFGYHVREGHLEFFVRDTGIGIPPAMHDEIFKRFRQLETSVARQFGGTGLGLSISKAYVELLGGTIWVVSEPGKGSEFIFTLPVTQVQAPVKFEEQYSDISPEKITPSKTLLIAEDEDSNYMLLDEILQKSGFRIIRAVNGDEAVEACRKFPEIDLVLMDIKMPIKDGFQATQEIKQFRPDLPVIAQTAFSSDEDHARAKEFGCVDIITKPIKREQFLARISRYLHSGVSS